MSKKYKSLEHTIRDVNGKQLDELAFLAPAVGAIARVAIPYAVSAILGSGSSDKKDSNPSQPSSSDSSSSDKVPDYNKDLGSSVSPPPTSSTSSSPPPPAQTATPKSSSKNPPLEPPKVNASSTPTPNKSKRTPLKKIKEEIIDESIGVIGSDEPQGTSKEFLTKRFKGIGHNIAGERVVAKQRNAAPIEEEKPCWDGYKAIGMKKKNGKKVPNCVPVKEESGNVPNHGNAAQVASWPTFEDSKGTKERKKIENVGREDSGNTKLSKQGEIKTKIIDEAILSSFFTDKLKKNKEEKEEKEEKESGKTPIEINPKVNKASSDV